MYELNREQRSVHCAYWLYVSPMLAAASRSTRSDCTSGQNFSRGARDDCVDPLEPRRGPEPFECVARLRKQGL